MDKIWAQMDEYYKDIRAGETSFSTTLYNLDNTPWTYAVLNLLPYSSGTSPIWEYLDTLLWISDTADVSFAYAYSEKDGELPLIFERDWDNRDGDTCKGIANGKYFLASIPEQEVTWKQPIPRQFDYVGYLWQNYGFDLGWIQ
ncbi:MAG: hypothetical protein K5770_18815 [Lachnospiraceae bacterium]|nr:hypothetical protein [Lachnospiraceae bacterium]